MLSISDIGKFNFGVFRPKAILWIAVLSFLLCYEKSCLAEGTDSAKEPVEFYRQIEPILKLKCHACHGGKIHESDLWLDEYDKVMEGGASGKIVIPGNAEKSSLYRVAARLEEPAMPPLPNDLQISALTANELELLRRWIDDGAIAGKKVAPQSTRWRSISSNQKQIYSLALSPDQRTLAIGQANQIILYDMLARRETERLVAPFLEGVADVDFIQSLAFSPDGDRIASGGYRNAKIWKRAAPRAMMSQKFDQPVRHARVDNEGIHAAFLLEDSEILLWNLVTGEPGQSIPASDDPVNGDPVSDMAFIPSQNRIIVGRQSGKIEIRSVITGELESGFQTPVSITSIQVLQKVLQNNAGFVTAHADDIIRIWPDANGLTKDGLDSVKPVRELHGDPSPIAAICVLPQSSQLLSVTADQTLRLRDLSTGATLWTRTVDAPVTMLAGSDVAERLVTAGPDGTVHLWKIDGTPVASGRAAAPLVRQQNEAFLSVELARRKNQRATEKLEQSEKDLAERKRLLTVAQEERQQSEAELDKENQELQTLLTEQQQAQEQTNASPDNEPLKQTLADVSKRRESKSELVEKAQLRLQTTSRAVAHAEQSVQFGLDHLHRRRSAIEQAHEELEASENNLAVITQQGEQSGKTTNSITISQDGQLVLASAPRESLRAWSLTTGAPVDMPVLSGRPAQQVIALPMGKVLKIDTQGTAVLWDLTPHWQLEQVLGPPMNEPNHLEASRIIHRVNTLAFHPQANRLVTGGGEPSRSGEVLIWNLDEPASPLEFRDAHSDTVLDLQFSRDGLKLVTCGADKFCRFFDVPNRTLMKSFEGHTDHVMGVALSLDEELLVSGGADQLIKVWDVETGELKRTIDTSSRQVTSVDFLGQSSEQILSSSGDHHVRIHIAATGKLEKAFAESKGYVYVAIASADGQQIIAGGEDGIVRIWNIQTGKLEELTF
ncbi:MAG TPA: c-type cytochrome domain-containing protein [Planctomicrobium sp.]|nr:c-type cytochrome domain-containing protein [Planctomicrobium sp.]